MNIITIKRSLQYLLLICIVSFMSCTKDPKIEGPQVAAYNYELIKSWNTLIGSIEYGYGEYRPCPIATVIAYTNFANYETAIPGMSSYRSLADNYPGLELPVFDKNQEINWPVAVNAASAYMCKLYFPKDISKVSAKETEMYNKYSVNTDQKINDASVTWGQKVAKAVFDYSASDLVTFDGYLNLYPAYTEKTGDGYWVPTPPDFSKGKFPQWGKGRCFAISEADKQIPPPLAYSTNKNSPYYGQAYEAYIRSTNGTPEDKWIGEFWSDDLANLTFSPPVRWLEIANQVYAHNNCSLEKAIVTNTKLGFAENDAAIACWDQKFKYQVERPVTYILKYIDPNYKTALTKDGLTPNFPTYPSGHGTFGSASAEVLTYEFGNNFAMTDRCHEGRTEFNGTPRSFTSFYQMAEENAESRIPLGVHFRMDAKESLTLGYRIGNRVNQLPFGK